MEKQIISLTKNRIKTKYYAFIQDDGEMDLTPTTLFSKMIDENDYSPSTKKVYAGIIDNFFTTIRQYTSNKSKQPASFKTISNDELRGFMQGYYKKELPFQLKNGTNISIERMNMVECVLKELFNIGGKYGFCERKSRLLSYQIDDETTSLDRADIILSQHINKSQLNELLENITTQSSFERDRDQLALKMGYELGLRSGELVRGNNFSISRLEKVRLEYRFGEAIPWNIVGKGRGGGKTREILIKPRLAENLFDFINKYEALFKNSNHLFTQRNGKKLSPQYGTKTFYHAKNNINDPQLNNLSFHSLRHTYATNLALWCQENQINDRLVQDRLGHTYPETTAIYIEVAHIMNNNLEKSQEMRMVRLNQRTTKNGKRNHEQ